MCSPDHTRQNDGDRLALPGETVDNIIDHLYDDFPSLKSCALVCRAWLPSCRFHLFDTVCCSPTRPTATLQRFYDWLLASPDAAPYVDALVIAEAKEADCPDVSVDDLERCLSLLPKLNQLILRGISLSCRSPSEMSFVGAHPRPILLLRFEESRMSGGAFHPFFRLLGLFSQLDFLMLNVLRCPWDERDVTEYTPQLLQLASGFTVRRYLLLGVLERPNAGSEGILFLLEHAQSAWPISMMAALQPSIPQSGIVGRIVERCQETLAFIQIDVMATLGLDVTSQRPFTSPEMWRSLDMTGCKLLEKIQLHLHVLKGGSESPDAFYRASLSSNVALLESSPQHIREIDLCIVNLDDNPIVFPRAWDQPSWRSLDDVLCRFPALRAVSVIFAESASCYSNGHLDTTNSRRILMAHMALESDSTYAAFLREVLPRMHATGLLNLQIRL